MKREKAVAVGNRAGIVEWANAAWSRVTGYALEDSIAKPVADLLGQAGIEPHVIGFVRRCFERGEPCEIELPLAPPGGAPRWIHVSVESLRDGWGEVSHFAAIAWDVTEEKRREAEAPAARTVDPGRAAPSRPPRKTGAGGPAAGPAAASELALRRTDLSDFVRERVGRLAPASPARAAFDLALPAHLPWVALDRQRVAASLADLLRDAVQAIGTEWGTVSVGTGLARNDEVLISSSYPRDCLLRGLERGLYVYVEVHDTGPPLARSVLDALAGRARPDTAHGRAATLETARDLARAHGGALRADADPGFGTRVILLFPT